MMVGDLAQALLADKQFNIEFNGYLSNHAKHAIIALDRLEAPESRVQQYWDQYTGVTPYDLELEKVGQDWESVEPATLAEWNEWKGKKIHWQQQVVFMNQELQRLGNDTDELVKTYAPSLFPGIAGALTHGIIHLGWAVDAQSPWMITEGLAYLNFAYMGLDEDKLVPKKHSEGKPMESFIRVAQVSAQESLKETWIERVKAKYDESFHAELVPAGFQWHVAKAMKEPHAVALELPTWLNQNPLDQVWKDLYKAVVYIYLATRDGEGNGNFVILHLLTSLWGLEQTLTAAKASKDEVRRALSIFYSTAVILLSMNGFPSAESLEEIQTKYPTTSMDKPSLDWAPIVEAGIAETEEHNIKLVYVMRELWKRYERWSGFMESAKSFTLTPNVGPNPFTGAESSR